MGFNRYAPGRVRHHEYVVTLAQSLKRRHCDADFRPQPSDYQLLSIGFLYRRDESRVLPGINKRTIDWLLVGTDILNSFDDVPATLFQNRRENCRDVKYLCCLR